MPRVHISGDAREGEGREGPSKIKNKGRKAAAAAYALMKFLTITLAATGEKVGIIGNGAKTMMNGLGIDERNINSNASPHCGCEEKEEEEKEETFPSANTSTKGISTIFPPHRVSPHYRYYHPEFLIELVPRFDSARSIDPSLPTLFPDCILTIARQ